MIQAMPYYAHRQNFEIDQFTPGEIAFKLVNPVTGNPVNLEGFSFEVWVYEMGGALKEFYLSATTVLPDPEADPVTLDGTEGYVTIYPSEGSVSVYLPPELFDTFVNTRCSYSVLAIPSGGSYNDRKQILSGLLTRLNGVSGSTDEDLTPEISYEAPAYSSPG